MATLVEHLRDYLVAEQLVRVPRESTPAGRPPLWLEPKEGLRAPGEPKDATGPQAIEVGPDLVVGAYLVNGIPPQPYESWLRSDAVEFRLRARTAKHAHEFEPGLREALLDKRDWVMAGLGVIESEMWTPLQRLGSDSQAFDYSVQFLFQLYA